VAEKQKPDPAIRLKLIHKGLHKIQQGDVVSRYLKSRGINRLPTHNLFIHNNIAYYGGYDNNNQKVTGVFTAMVGRISDNNGNLESYHVTYLTQDARKIDFAQAKVIITPKHTISGCGIKLSPPAERIAITEGIETALAIEENEDIPCWAAISSGGMRKIEIPIQVKNVDIYSDRDTNYAGQSAAYHLAHSLSCKGVSVRVLCEWEMGSDYLDWINRNTVTNKADI